MKMNMGKNDRLIRGIIAVIAIILAIIFGLQLFNWIPITLIVIAVIMGGTALIGFCPLYVPLKISTNKE